MLTKNIQLRKYKFSINKLENKLVTHHWSDNWNKGFDIYKRIDDSISEDNSMKLNLPHGNVPKILNLKNRGFKSNRGLDLATELKT